MNLPLAIASRYLLARKSHSAVNVISAISVAGVAVAVAAMVVVLSVFNGFSDLARAHLSVLDPDVIVAPARGNSIAAADSLASVIGHRDDVDAASAVLQQRGLLVGGDRQAAVIFKGVPEGYSSVVNIDTATVASSAFTGQYAPDGSGITDVAVGVANYLELIPGTSGLTLYVPRRLGRINPANPAAAFMSQQLTAGRVFQVDQMEIDADHIYVPLEAAREALQFYDGEASAIEVRARGVSPEHLARDLQTSLGDDFTVTPRSALHSASLMLVSVEKWVTFAMLGFILLVASFNIISTLSLMVIEKRGNMATLIFLGASRRMARSVFMWMGALITMAGGVCGIVLGVALSLAQQLGGFIRLSGDPSQLTVDVYPVRVAVGDVGAVLLIILAVAMLAALVTRLFTRKFD